MATRKFIGGVDLMMDDSTGAVLVNGGKLIAGPNLVTVDSTATGKTLAGLGLTLNANLKRLTLDAQAVGIFWAAGAASATSPPLREGVTELDVDKGYGDTLKFYAAGDTKMVVVQEG